MHKAFFIRTDDRGQLFATANNCNVDKRVKLGVLFCHAFGEERQKIYRSTFHFANALADHGIPSLRFDYIGTGDSEGDLPEVSLDSMLQDTLAAAKTAKEVLNVDHLLLLGIRLGAVIAARATVILDSADACIMWNPIVDGADYLRELKRTEKIIRMTGKKSGTEPLILPEIEDLTVIEADQMSALMVEQLNALDLITEPLIFTQLFVAGRQDDMKEQSRINSLTDACQGNIKNIESWLEQPREYWSTGSMYDAYFPTPTFDISLKWIHSLASQT